MDIATRCARAPALNTLNIMFGDDTQIGEYSRHRKTEELRQSKSLSDAIEIIIKYAEDVHKEQKEYDNISPFGGLDITIQPVDEIAFAQEDVLKEKFPDYREDVLYGIAAALQKNGHLLTGVQRFCETYESVNGGLENDITNAWLDHKKERKRSERREQRAKNAYAVCRQALQDEIDELERALNGMTQLGKLFRRKKRMLREARINEMIALKESLTSGVNLPNIEENGFISFFYPWEDEDFASPTTLYTREDMEDAIACIHDYAAPFIKSHRGTYQRARKLLAEYSQNRAAEQEEKYAF